MFPCILGIVGNSENKRKAKALAGQRVNKDIAIGVIVDNIMEGNYR